MNNNYETVIIFTPILNSEEVKKQIKKYTDLIKEDGGNIVHEDHWGLKQLAYPIQKKTTGIYHIVEYDAPGSFVDKLELQFRRDENVMRFLTTVLDKFSLDYNDRKRNGLIGRKKDKKEGSEDTAKTEQSKPEEKAAVVTDSKIENNNE